MPLRLCLLPLLLLLTTTLPVPCHAEVSSTATANVLEAAKLFIAESLVAYSASTTTDANNSTTTPSPSPPERAQLIEAVRGALRARVEWVSAAHSMPENVIGRTYMAVESLDTREMAATSVPPQLRSGGGTASSDAPLVKRAVYAATVAHYSRARQQRQQYQNDDDGSDLVLIQLNAGVAWDARVPPFHSQPHTACTGGGGGEGTERFSLFVTLVHELLHGMGIGSFCRKVVTSDGNNHQQHHLECSVNGLKAKGDGNDNGGGGGNNNFDVAAAAHFSAFDHQVVLLHGHDHQQSPLLECDDEHHHQESQQQQRCWVSPLVTATTTSTSSSITGATVTGGVPLQTPEQQQATTDDGGNNSFAAAFRDQTTLSHLRTAYSFYSRKAITAHGVGETCAVPQALSADTLRVLLSLGWYSHIGGESSLATTATTGAVAGGDAHSNNNSVVLYDECLDYTYFYQHNGLSDGMLIPTARGTPKQERPCKCFAECYSYSTTASRSWRWSYYGTQCPSRCRGYWGYWYAAVWIFFVFLFLCMLCMLMAW